MNIMNKKKVKDEHLEQLWYMKEEGTDFHAIEQGRVSITPLTMDLTHYQALSELQGTEHSPQANRPD